jgi:hypothetical protein
MGLLTVEEVANPPSPEEKPTPVPATVLIRYGGGTADTKILQKARVWRKKTRNKHDGETTIRKSLLVG